MPDAIRLLVVDEDPDSRVEMRKALQRARLTATSESGFGTAAVSLALEVNPDVILIAIEEPSSRPLETAESLANALPDTPIVIYSSLTDAESVRRAMVFGARDYLVRPLNPTRLEEAVARALEAEERRQMRRAGQVDGGHGRGTVITVTGAKGGVGKSVISVNLALALRSETRKAVAIIDCDTSFGDVLTMLDLAAVTGLDDLAQRPVESLRDTIREHVTTHASGLAVIAGSRDEETWERCSPDHLKTIITTLAQLYEFVVVDTAATFDRYVRAAVEASTLTLVVTSAEVSSIMDSSAAVERMTRWGITADRYRMVLNRGTRASGVKRDEAGVALGHPVFWELPNDRAVTTGVQLGRPVVLDGRKSAVGAELIAMARRIAGMSSEPQRSKNPSRITRAIRLSRGRRPAEGGAE
ncbi:MAG TPA: response regulator [Tepidiformaceae bacterium]|nr:response regulator [Tepidiformaceae bacterium]